MTLNAALGLQLLLTLCGTIAQAQGTVVTAKHQVACARCRVEFTPAVTVAKASDPASITPLGFPLVQDSQGRFVSFSDESQLISYDANGNFVRAVGRAGDGPGEFTPRALGGAPAIAVGAGDTILVFDRARISVFTADLRYVRTIIPAPLILNTRAAYALAGGRWLVNGEVRTSALGGYSAYIMDANGIVIASIGPRGARLPGSAWPSPRQFFPTRDRSSIWISGTNPLEFEQWSITGKRLSQLTITDAPYMRGQFGGALDLLGVDAQGRIWIKSAERTAPRPPARGSPIPPGQRTINLPTNLPPMTLEVLDPRSGAVLVSQPFTHGVRFLTDGSLVYGATEDTNGFIILQTRTFRIIGM